MITRLRAPFAAAAALFLAGCISGGSPPPASTISVSDSNVLQPVLRGAVTFPGTRGAAPSDPHTGHAVEFGLTRASGSSSEQLGSNYVSLGGQRFNAPTTLNYDFTLTYIDFAYRYRVLDESRTVGIEGLSGLVLTDFDFSVSSPTQRAGESQSSAGVQLGAGLFFRMRQGTSAHLRGVWFISGDENGVTQATRLDLYLMRALWRHATVRAGYSVWSLESERGGTVSPIEIDFRGPALGFELMF